MGRLDLVPDAHEIGLLLRQHDPAFEVLHILEKNLDLAAYGDRLQVVAELLDSDHALGFEADVDEDFAGLNAYYASLHDFPLFYPGEALVIQVVELRHLLLGVLRPVQLLYVDVSVDDLGGLGDRHVAVLFHGSLSVFRDCLSVFGHLYSRFLSLASPGRQSRALAGRIRTMARLEG